MAACQCSLHDAGSWLVDAAVLRFLDRVALCRCHCHSSATAAVWPQKTFCRVPSQRHPHRSLAQRILCQCRACAWRQGACVPPSGCQLCSSEGHLLLQRRWGFICEKRLFISFRSSLVTMSMDAFPSIALSTSLQMLLSVSFALQYKLSTL